MWCFITPSPPKTLHDESLSCEELDEENDPALTPAADCMQKTEVATHTKKSEMWKSLESPPHLFAFRFQGARLSSNRF